MRIAGFVYAYVRFWFPCNVGATDIAGISLPSQMDGSSLLPAAHTAGTSSTPTRLMNLIEYVGESNGGGPSSVCPLTNGSPLYCDAIGNFTQPPYWDGPDLCVCQDCTNNTYSCLRAFDGATGGFDFRYCEFAGMLIHACRCVCVCVLRCDPLLIKVYHSYVCEFGCMFAFVCISLICELFSARHCNDGNIALCGCLL